MGQDLDEAGGVLAVVPALKVVGGAGVGAAGIVVEALPPNGTVAEELKDVRPPIASLLEHGPLSGIP